MAHWPPSWLRQSLVDINFPIRKYSTSNQKLWRFACSAKGCIYILNHYADQAVVTHYTETNSYNFVIRYPCRQYICEQLKQIKFRNLFYISNHFPIFIKYNSFFKLTNYLLWKVFIDFSVKLSRTNCIISLICQIPLE